MFGDGFPLNVNAPDQEYGDDLELGIRCIEMTDEARIDSHGGYYSDIDLRVRGLVIVADLDPGKDYQRTDIVIYSQSKLRRLGRSLRRIVATRSRWCERDGTEMEDYEDEIREHIWDRLEKCKWTGPKGAKSPC